MDRSSSNDDNRGLNQPVDDNLPMVVKFQLTFEDTPSIAPNVDSRAISRSLKGLDRALKFNNPVTILSTKNEASWFKDQYSQRSLLSQNSALFALPDAHLLSFKLRDTSDKGREDETIIQVMRYLHDVNDGGK